MSGQHSPEPWGVYGTRVIARDGSSHGPYLAHFHGDSTTLGEDNANAARAVACVNALAGVPTVALTSRVLVGEVVLALAVLRGDESAAYGLADELLERRRQPDGFVSRAELVELLVLAAQEITAHDCEYSHVTPPALVRRIAGALIRLAPADPEVTRVGFIPGAPS